MCTCTALGLCVAGQRWDASPEVCGCVPDGDDPCARVRCPPGTTCVASGGSAECVPTLTCATVLCAPGTYCEETPSGPRCVESPVVTCASLRCRQGYECVDSPSGAECVRTPGGCTMDSDCLLYDQYCSSNPCACEVLGYNQRPATCAPDDQVACFRQPCAGRAAVCNGGRCEVL